MRRRKKETNFAKCWKKIKFTMSSSLTARNLWKNQLRADRKFSTFISWSYRYRANHRNSSHMANIYVCKFTHNAQSSSVSSLEFSNWMNKHHNNKCVRNAKMKKAATHIITRMKCVKRIFGIEKKRKKKRFARCVNLIKTTKNLRIFN